MFETKSYSNMLDVTANSDKIFVLLFWSSAKFYCSLNFLTLYESIL